LTKVLTIVTEYAQRRARIKNACNGHMNVGCVITDTKWTILATGINVYSDYGTKSMHAEHNAINALLSFLSRKHVRKHKRVNIIVYRTDRRGEKLQMAKPCANCTRIIYDNQGPYTVNRVYYTNRDGGISHL